MFVVRVFSVVFGLFYSIPTWSYIFAAVFLGFWVQRRRIFYVIKLRISYCIVRRCAYVCWCVCILLLGEFHKEYLLVFYGHIFNRTNRFLSLCIIALYSIFRVSCFFFDLCVEALKQPEGMHIGLLERIFYSLNR